MRIKSEIYSPASLSSASFDKSFGNSRRKFAGDCDRELDS